MARKKSSKKLKSSGEKTERSLKDVLSLYAKLADLKGEMKKVAESGERTEDRLTDMEVHVNVLARLLTTLCIERLGIRIGTLKRLLNRIEKEAQRDSQIMELESLYRLSHGNLRKSFPSGTKPKDDPWEQIS